METAAPTRAPRRRSPPRTRAEGAAPAGPGRVGNPPSPSGRWWPRRRRHRRSGRTPRRLRPRWWSRWPTTRRRGPREYGSAPAHLAGGDLGAQVQSHRQAQVWVTLEHRGLQSLGVVAVLGQFLLELGELGASEADHRSIGGGVGGTVAGDHEPGASRSISASVSAQACRSRGVGVSAVHACRPAKSRPPPTTARSSDCHRYSVRQTRSGWPPRSSKSWPSMLTWSPCSTSGTITSVVRFLPRCAQVLSLPCQLLLIRSTVVAGRRSAPPGTPGGSLPGRSSNQGRRW